MPAGPFLEVYHLQIWSGFSRQGQRAVAMDDQGEVRDFRLGRPRWTRGGQGGRAACKVRFSRLVTCGRTQPSLDVRAKTPLLPSGVFWHFTAPP